MGTLPSWFDRPFSVARRIVLCVTAIALSAGFFRGAISESLVVRGDTDLYRSNLRAAWAHYRRALYFDPSSAQAADRLLFVSGMSHDKKRIVAALRATSEAFGGSGSAKLYADRALCWLVLRRYQAAYRDFRRAAMIDRSALSFTFAGIAARRIHQLADARLLFRLALRKEPAYRPALVALGAVR